LRHVKSIVVLLMVATASAFIVFWLMIVKPVNELMASATPRNARTDMLPDGADALILMPFVTGDVPRLVRGEALEKWSQNLWFTDNVDAGNLIGAVLLGMGGMPPSTEIGTAFRDGTPVKNFECLTVGCINWPKGAPDMWGLSDLRGQGASLGPEVQLEQSSFSDYKAYLAAHSAVATDPLRWFADPGAEVPQPDTDGLRLVVVTLPTRLVPTSPNLEKQGLPKDSVIAQELQALAAQLIEGSGGEVQAIYGAEIMPLWVTKDGEYLRDDGAGSRALPDLVMHSPTLQLRVPAEFVATIRERLAATALPSLDLATLAPVIARAFAAWNIDRACLPGCGGVIPPNEFRHQARVDVSGDPFWTLAVWHISQVAD